MAVFWLDLVRYADTMGYHSDNVQTKPLYREYVINAFNENRPFDEFIRGQLAGDLLPHPSNAAITNRRLTATTYLAMGIKIAAEKDGAKKESDIIDEQIDTISRSLLGVTVACARCHDHKFDPVSTRDYYSMASIFKSTKTMENFNVVAVWHEYEFPSGEERQLKAKLEAVSYTHLTLPTNREV